jgi:hypothetical protein
VLKNLLNAGKSPNLGFAYDLFFLLITIIYVKIAMTRGQPAGVRSIHASEASQRLHAGDLLAEQKKIIPNYITGFSDGEATFHISILKNNNYKTGYHVMPVFSIQLHIKDLSLLELFKSYFKVGTLKIKKNKDNTTVIYSIQSVKDILAVIIPHFDEYPLLTKKRADYILFKQIIHLMNDSKHLTKEGLKEIVSIKASMNNGLNENLKNEFNIVAVQRPLVELVNWELNKDWLAGFIEAEACFLCLVRKNIKHKLGYQVTLSFTLTQHSKDLDLMTKIKDSLGLGIIYENSSILRLTITKKSEIDILIDILKGMLLGAKLLDFEDFVKIQEIINSDLHKSNEGLEKILEIKNGMNTGRKHEK